VRQTEALQQRPVIAACWTDLGQTAFLLEERTEDAMSLTSQILSYRHLTNKQSCSKKRLYDARSRLKLVHPSGWFNKTIAMKIVQKRRKKESLISTSQLFSRDSPNGTTCRKLSHLSFLVLLQIRSLMAEYRARDSLAGGIRAEQVGFPPHTR
jgi:hypothetical protein